MIMRVICLYSQDKDIQDRDCPFADEAVALLGQEEELKPNQFNGRHSHDCDFDICIQNTKPAFLLYSDIAEVTYFGFHPTNHKICKLVSKIN